MYCETCRFWETDDHKEQGICHRNPPTVMFVGVDRSGQGHLHKTYVQTEKREWCGEYIAKRANRRRRK